MTTGLREISDADLTEAIVQILLPRLAEQMRLRAPGHCMRVADLDRGLMVALCRSLRMQVANVQTFILGTADNVDADDDLYVSSTKLVELRNPLPNGELRPPLVVFLPPQTRASAEDSFGVATFEEIVVSDVYGALLQSLLQRLPSDLQGYVINLFDTLRAEQWPWADPVARARYLLTALANGADGETLGASLFELGLVPDFRLMDDPTTVLGHIRKNMGSVRSLTDSDQTVRGRVLELRLSDKSIQDRLMRLLIDTGVEDPQRWTRRIVIDSSNWGISFDKWQFEEEIRPERISIYEVTTDLPTIAEDETDERLQGLIEQQVLAPQDRRKIGVTFSVNPQPLQVPGLDHFSVQIVTKDGGPVGVAKKVKAWKAKKSSTSVSLDKLDRIEFEEGWHFIRVLAWTEHDDPIPIAYPESADLDEAQSKPNESEPFYVLPDGSIGDEPPQRAIPLEASLEHARLRLQFTAIGAARDPWTIRSERIVWVEKSSKTRQTNQDTLEIRFGRDGIFHVPVARVLRGLEQHILKSPYEAVSWRLMINRGEVNAPAISVHEWPRSSAVDSFLGARARYFEALRAQGTDFISQAADFIALKPYCAEYAEAYDDLLTDLQHKVEQSAGGDQQKVIAALRTVLAVDTIHLTITDFRGTLREAILLAPTHPLRALWFATWAELGRGWIHATSSSTGEAIGPVRDALLEQLTPLNIPATLPLADGKIFTCVDNLTPFWSLYAAAMEEDARGLLGEICAAFGLQEPTIGGTTVTGEVLGSRIARYALQHPYVRTLSINVFNPGRASVLASALVWLQRQEVFSHLRYDIRLFVRDPEAPGVGEALDLLLSPTGSTSSEAADAFTTSTGNHLFPKLSFAVRSTQSFREDPTQYRAHLSILLDLFPAEEVGIGPALAPVESTPLHGLIQDYATDFQDNNGQTLWRRQPRHGRVRPLPGAEVMVDLLARLPQRISGATATISTGVPAFDARPIVLLGLDAEQRELVHHIHIVSDWVYTIDRHFGIEFFDHKPQSDRPEYLIDYVPSAAGDFGHRLLITSRSVTELEAMLGPVLDRYGIPTEIGSASTILSQLRALSGRLALKLISAPNQQAEVLGLALARLYLERQGALSNQLIVPLDTHQNLFQSARHQAEELGEAVTLHRTDLALIDLNAADRTIRCNLVEVKCYTQLGSLASYNQLKEDILRQIERSEQVLREHFDPHLKSPDRPDRLIKIREFASLLEFYLHRSVRYGLLDVDAADEAQHMLATLEDSYTLRFTRSALIFDFQKSGTEAAEYEHDIEYHRIGIDVIHALVAEMSISDSGSLNTVSSIHGRASVPRLASAAFIAPKRDWSTTWDKVGRDSGSIYTRQPESAEPASSSDHTRRHNANTDVDPNTSNDEVAHLNGSDEAPSLGQASGVNQSHQLSGDEQSKATEDGARPADSGAPIRAQSPDYDVILGAHGRSPQYGILGEIAGRKVALDLDQTHTISLFGVQGGGKSYTLGSIIEMACAPIPAVNCLPNPLATIIFHYSPTQDYPPEFTSVVNPNSDPDQLAQLHTRYGAEPQALEDVVILVPAAKVAERRLEFPDVSVMPIAFAASELKATHWKFLMGAVGSQSMYLRQINLIMRRLRENLTLDELMRSVEESALSEHLKELARTRLQFAAEYIDDSRRVMDIIRPGRLVIVDLRDEFIEKDEALGLFVVLLQLFSDATYEGHSFNKLVVFDEAHKYIESSDLVAGLVEVVREMRHKGTSVMVASQDPPSVPIALIELSTEILLHRFNSPAWLKHIQRANAALSNLTPERMNQLGPGDAYAWASRASDEGFSRGAMKIRCRPRVTQHGGGTKTATAGSETGQAAR